MVLQDTNCIPQTLSVDPAINPFPMNESARTMIDKVYKPDLIGVPKVGEPFQLSLDPIPTSEILIQIIDSLFEGAEPTAAEQLRVFMLRDPLSLIAYNTPEHTGEKAVKICDDRLDPNCKAKGVDTWISKASAKKQSVFKDFCPK